MNDHQKPSASAQEMQRAAKAVQQALLYDVQFGSGYHTLDTLKKWGYRSSNHLDDDRVWRATIQGPGATGQAVKVEGTGTYKAVEALEEAVEALRAGPLRS